MTTRRTSTSQTSMRLTLSMKSYTNLMIATSLPIEIQLLDTKSSQNTVMESRSPPRDQPIGHTLHHPLPTDTIPHCQQCVQPIGRMLHHPLPTDTIPHCQQCVQLIGRMLQILTMPMMDTVPIMDTVDQLCDQPIGHILRIMMSTTMPILIQICLIPMHMCIPILFQMMHTHGNM